MSSRIALAVLLAITFIIPPMAVAENDTFTVIDTGPWIIAATPSGLYAFDNSGLYALDGEGGKTLVASGIIHPFIASASDGLLVRGEEGLVKIGATTETVSYEFALPAFSSTGIVYGCEGRTYRLATISTDRVITPLDNPCRGHLTFAPDGRAYVTQEGSIERVDLETGATTPIATLPGPTYSGIVFDTEGMAYVSASFGRILQVNVDTGGVETFHTLAPSQNAFSLAFQGSRLYLATSRYVQGTDVREVGYIETTRTGFTGFSAPLELAAPADLVVSGVTERTTVVSSSLILGQRTFTATITNVGAGVAHGPFDVVMSTDGLLSESAFFTITSTLDPGESATAAFTTSTMRRVGDYSVTFRADSGWDIVESNKDNNAFTHATYAWVPTP